MSSSRSALSRGLGAAVLLACALAVSGCTGGSTTTPTSGTSSSTGGMQAYTSKDGSTKAWAAGERGRPVTLAGKDFTGSAVSVASWRGEVVVLNTWFAACPPCRAEAPDLAAFAGDYATKGVRVLGINGTDDVGAAKAFERTFSIPYPSLDDAEGEAAAALQGAVPIQAVPTTVLLDRKGRVAARFIGMVDASTLRALVDTLLSEAA